MRTKIRLIGSAALLLPLMALEAGQAFAQAQSLSQGGDLDEVVVTARRRSEDLEKVPTAITAFGAAQLAERDIRTEEDLQAATPGLTLRETQGQNQLNYSIRGQTVDAFTGSATAVVPYMNEVQLNTGGASSFFDLDSVQVLKGPQGTLFGRNATGGAVLYTTAKPTNDFGGYVQVSGGNYSYYASQGAINLPVVADKVLLRAAFDVDSRDGFQHNIYNNQEYGGISNQSGRLSLTLQPIDNFKNETVVEYGHSGGTNISLRPFSIYTHGQRGPDGTLLSSAAADTYSPAGLGAGWAAYIAGNPGILRSQPNALAVGLPGYLAYSNTQPFWQVATPEGGMHKDFHDFITNSTSYDVSPDLAIKNILGISHDRTLDDTPQLGIPYGGQYTDNLNLSQFGNDVTTLSYSEEFQVQGKTFNRALTYILGTYYQHTNQYIFYPQTYYNLAPLPGVNGPYGFGNTSDYKNGDSNEAIFAQGTYDLSGAGVEGLSLTGGLRYSFEQITLHHLPGSTNRQGQYQDVDFHKPSWEVGLEYEVNPDVMTYLKTRGSWRAGGLNGNAAPVNALASGGGDEFLPETTHDVELGLKFGGRLFNEPAHLNVALYKQWIDNVQRFETPTVCPVGGPCYSIAVTVNVPSAQVQGIEADASIKPAPWLTLGASGALTDAKFIDNTALLYGTLYTFGPYPDTPKASGAFYAQIQLPVPENMSVRGDIYMQTGQWFSSNGNSLIPDTELPGYKLVNMHYDWHHLLGSKVSLGAFVRNLTNEKYYVGGLAEGASFGVNSAAVGRPRMYGAEARYDF